MKSIADSILRRIRAKKRGWVFTPKDFLDIGARAAVDQTLSRLAKQGKIRRLDRGVYDFPRQHKRVGALSPSPDNVAQAITAKSGNRAFPSGAMALNKLGLSTQVPAKPVYLTNGPTRTLQVGNRTIRLQHARVPIFDDLSPIANTVLQGLYHLGRDDIDGLVVDRCAKLLDDRDVRGLKSVAARIPGWMADLVLRIEAAR